MSIQNAQRLVETYVGEFNLLIERSQVRPLKADISIPSSQRGPEFNWSRFMDNNWWDFTQDLMAEENRKLISVDRELFHREMTALSFEVFGLACNRNFRDAENIVIQSYITRKHLAELERLDIWETMGEYNAALGNPDYGQDLLGRSDDSLVGMALRPFTRSRIENEASARLSFVRKYTSAIRAYNEWPFSREEFIEDCVRRAANRMHVDPHGEDRMAVKLGERLGCHENSDHYDRMSTFVVLAQLVSSVLYASALSPIDRAKEQRGWKF